MKNSSRTDTILGIGFVAVLVFAIILSIFISTAPQQASATAPAGLNAQVATSSTLNVGPQNNMYAFGTTTREYGYQCAARVVTTGFDAIRISFASLSSTTLSTTVGHLQASSTTQVYDGGLFGCGYMTIRGTVSSTTLTIAETH